MEKVATNNLEVDDSLFGYRKVTYDEITSKEGLILLAAWTRDGIKQIDIIKRLGITQQTWQNWKRKSEQDYDDPIGTALSKGKELIDYQVENALLKAALGYKSITTKTIIGPPDKDGTCQVRTERTETTVGPNHTACLAWLNNRRPDKWRRNRDNMLEYEDQKHGITINIVKGGEVTTLTDGSNNEADDDNDAW